MTLSGGSFDTEISSEYMFSKLKHRNVRDDVHLGYIHRCYRCGLWEVRLVGVEQG
jgi:hypothetical protein